MELMAWLLIMLLSVAFVAVIFTAALSLTRGEGRAKTLKDGRG